MPAPAIVITGATSGLGQLAAINLARRGARLILPARNPHKAAETEKLIRTAAPRAAIDVYLADLSRITDVRRLGREILHDNDEIDVLINNAGLHAFESRATPDGYPEMIAVNYLAPWVLTNELLPALSAAPEARVVTVASEASRRHGTLRLPDDLIDVVPFTARGSSEHYGKSKLLGIMFTMELARRLEGTTVAATCLDPGFNVTGLGRELRVAAVLERVLRALHVGDPARGAGLIVNLAAAQEFSGVNGEYWTIRGPRAITPAAPGNDPQAQRDLWEATRNLVGD
ncbi:NAD(P)-dependent dehydrogenase (short-subunit alcohol dehydrogenase family) [Rhodococcus sp. LBL1]|nr:NAD(P)-dependent dehydrogenase (short-subunit alcohol dehydrogenase family) [Rhodococcus sp. LBL1]MDH6681744.1 NAD(P)-dependent dehydrogenase (short-subunit alcohol dehydrogenase family) [Rhodococcus sp. LBL2]